MTDRLPKSQWHWKCRWFGHRYIQGFAAGFYTNNCTRCGFDPRTKP